MGSWLDGDVCLLFSQQSERLPAAISTHAEDRLSTNSIQFRRRQMANMLSPYIPDTLRRNESPTCHFLDEYIDIFNANTLGQYPESEINIETTAAFTSTEPASFILLYFLITFSIIIIIDFRIKPCYKVLSHTQIRTLLIVGQLTRAKEDKKDGRRVKKPSGSHRLSGQIFPSGEQIDSAGERKYSTGRHLTEAAPVGTRTSICREDQQCIAEPAGEGKPQLGHQSIHNVFTDDRERLL